MADVEGLEAITIEVQTVEVTNINLDGAPGPQGLQGLNGWSAVHSLQSDGERRVLRLDNWVGGTEPIPGFIGYYLASTGYVADIANGVDIRGAIGVEGPAGPAGQDGAVLVGEGSGILTGEGPPAPDLGFTGDLYVDTISQDVYSKKAADGFPDGVWEVQLNIRGSAGAQGSQGPAGSDGAAGVNGVIGWSPVYTIVTDGQRLVLRNTDWTGSTGNKPATGQYLGEGVLVSDIALAINIRGGTGAAGAPGFVGTNGLNFYRGNGVPNAGLGVAGETYLDVVALVLYTKAGGPAVWTAQGTIKGADGAAGTAGAQGPQGLSWRYGSGVPASGLGNDGDSYVDTDSAGRNYYTKAAGAWTLVGPLKGADGADGADGAQGPAGPQGNPGAASTVPGPAGKSFLYGTAVPDANVGADGFTYVRTTTFHLYTRAGTVWTDVGSIKGVDGTNGNDGANGIDGQSFRYGSVDPSTGVGNSGDTYLQTVTFHLWTKADATWTDVGSIKGADGAPGAAGAAGLSMRTGVGSPSNGLGVNGDSYVNSSNGDLYLKAANTYSVVGSLKGPQGIQGVQGTAGADGAPGAQGIPGTTGAQGTPGTAGSAGAAGTQFTTGAGVPTGGAANDLYIRTSNYDLYKNVAGTWTVIGNVKGAAGVDAIGAADFSIFIPGKPTTSQVLYEHDVVRAFTWPVSLTGSRFKARTAATASYVITIAKNGTSIGTLTWAAAGTVPTVVFTTATTFVANTDIITLTGQSTVDATLADLVLSFLGSR